jgi:hypothetical protein
MDRRYSIVRKLALLLVVLGIVFSWVALRLHSTGDTDKDGVPGGTAMPPSTEEASADPGMRGSQGEEATVSARTEVVTDAAPSLESKAAGRETSGVVTGPSVCGLVLDEAGTAVERFEIVLARIYQESTGSLFDATIPGSALRRGGRARAFQDARGEFVLTGLTPGRWAVLARAPERGVSLKRTISIPGDGEPLLLTIRRFGFLRGRVVDRNGRPLAEARVLAEPARSFEELEPRSTQSENAGLFNLGEIPPGTWNVWAEMRGFAPSRKELVEVAPGQVAGGVELVMRLSGTITGEAFLSGGRPAALRQIVAFHGGTAEVETIADEAGRFAFEDLQPGEWNLGIEPTPEERERARGAEAEEREVLPRELFISESALLREGESIHVLLGALPEAALRVHGRIRVGGAPTAGLELWVQKGTREVEATAKCDALGRYAVFLEGPGRYEFAVHFDGSSQSKVVTVPDVASLELDLDFSVGSISGRVFGLDGEPAGGVSLEAVRTSDPESSMFTSFGLTTTNDGGFYLVEDLEPGHYSVAARFYSGGASFNDSGFVIAEGVVVSAGAQTQGVNLSLEGAGELTGCVVDERGQPVAGAQVFVWSLGAERSSGLRQAVCGPRGRFHLVGFSGEVVDILAAGGTCATPVLRDFRIEPGSSHEVRLSLQEGFRVEVIVSDVAGISVPFWPGLEDERGLPLHFLGGASSRSGFDWDGGDGRVILGPIPAGSYTVTAFGLEDAAGGSPARATVHVGGEPQARVELIVR